MDLNYLFFRQQVEKTRADHATNTEARNAHDHLARCYEYRISRATDGRIRFRMDRASRTSASGCASQPRF